MIMSVYSRHCVYMYVCCKKLYSLSKESLFKGANSKRHTEVIKITSEKAMKP